MFSDVSRQGKNRNAKTIKRLVRFKEVKSPRTGRWHYNGNEDDSVTFSVNHDVVIHGIRLFGREGATYSVTVGLYRKGTRTDTEKLTEEHGRFNTDKDIASDYYGFDVLFKTLVTVKKYEMYEIRAVINGPISYYGEQGQTQVTDQGICFSFSKTSSSINGTSVAWGQFPEILFL